jgi:hypothetical protein
MSATQESQRVSADSHREYLLTLTKSKDKQTNLARKHAPEHGDPNNKPEYGHEDMPEFWP